MSRIEVVIALFGKNARCGAQNKLQLLIVARKVLQFGSHSLLSRSTRVAAGAAVLFNLLLLFSPQFSHPLQPALLEGLECVT